MKKILILLLSAFLTLSAIGCSGKTANTIPEADYTLSPEELAYEAEYDKACPYGDAVIIPNHPNSEAILVSCVNYIPSSNKFKTWTGELFGNREYQEWSPTSVRVYTQDGELLVSNNTIRVQAIN